MKRASLPAVLVLLAPTASILSSVMIPMPAADARTTPAPTQLLWEGIPSALAESKVTTLACDADAVVVATSNVYGAAPEGRSSLVRVTGDGRAKLIHVGREETLGPRFGPFFAVEHGAALLRHARGKVSAAARLP